MSPNSELDFKISLISLHFIRVFPKIMRFFPISRCLCSERAVSEFQIEQLQ